MPRKVARPIERLRGRAGQAQRLRRLRRTHGLCEICANEGTTTEATVVDHIVPLALGGTDQDDNTRNLCAEHHRQVTAEQFGHHVAFGARGVSLSGRPVDRRHAWNADGPPAQLPPAAGPPGGRKSPTPLTVHRYRGACAARGVPE